MQAMRAKPIVGTKARLGDIAALELKSSFTYLHGKTIARRYWTIEEVTGVDRDGRITSTRTASGQKTKARHLSSMIVGSHKLDKSALIHDISQRTTNELEFESIDDLRSYLRGFLV